MSRSPGPRLRRFFARSLRIPTVGLACFATLGFAVPASSPHILAAENPISGTQDKCSHLWGLRLSSIGPLDQFSRSAVEPKKARLPSVPNAQEKRGRVTASSKRAERHRSQYDRLVGVPATLANLVNNDGADILASAYTPNDAFHDARNPFDRLLGSGDTSGRFVPPAAGGDHPWIKTALPAEVFSAPEQKCLATAIYFEARGEELKGQAAVAQVILNRVRNPAYPDTVCDVVYQNQDLPNRCQFSFACDGIADVVTDRRAFQLAEQIAMAVTAGKIFLSDVASSTHYNATYVSPSWSRSMERMTQIGSHIFYRTFGGGWS